MYLVQDEDLQGLTWCFRGIFDGYREPAVSLKRTECFKYQTMTKADKYSSYFLPMDAANTIIGDIFPCNCGPNNDPNRLSYHNNPITYPLPISRNVNTNLPIHSLVLCDGNDRL